MTNVNHKNHQNNPKGFNEAALKVIEALGGDITTGRCFCPIHGDGQRPSLQVNNGTKIPVVVHCFGGGGDHDAEVVAYLREKGVLPTTANLSSSKIADEDNQKRSSKKRRNYAVGIWNALKNSGGRNFGPMLEVYLNTRRIKKAPPTAMMTLPIGFTDSTVGSHEPGMVLPIRNAEGKLQGIHVTWLNADLTDKCSEEPQRQSYGVVKGNFVALDVKIDYDKPPDTLLIGEGVETVLSGMQLTDLPGIASAGAWNIVTPPRCKRYIILADNGDAGQKWAKNLAQHLLEQFPDSAVQIATPIKPTDAKEGYDWNDALMGDTGAGILAMAINAAPNADAAQVQREKLLTELAALDRLDYETKREEASRELGLRRSVLDEEVAKRAKKKTPPTVEPVDIKKLAKTAKDIIESDDVLQQFLDDFSQVFAGERRNAQLLYLAATSRLLPEAMHTVIKGPSAVGKSRLRQRVLAFFPPEHVINFTALSEKALLYIEEDFAHKVLSMGEAMTGKQQDFQDYLLRELMPEGKLRYLVPIKEDGVIQTTLIEKDGPVAFMVTTTRSKLNAENETRMLSLEVDDSEEQTKAVMAKVAEVDGLDELIKPETLHKWHDYQRWLAAGECRVIVPFAPALAKLIPAKSVRLRRDFGQLLHAIKAHALLHRKQRECDDKGQIVATVDDDYRIVCQLMGKLLAETSEVRLRRAIVQTVEAVEACQPEYGPNHGETGAPVRAIAQKLKLDKSATWRRLRQAEDAGFIFNLETRPHRAGHYRTTGQEPVSLKILPEPDVLLKRDENL